MILEALFNGEIYASEDIVPKSDRFRQTAAHISEAMTYFKGKLSKEDYTLLEKLRDSHADESNMTNECQFKYGFTMGVLLMCEIHDIENDEVVELPRLYNTIGAMFSRPYNGDASKYLSTQYIAEEIKNMGFDGLRFRSSLNKNGYNIVLFNPDDCVAVSSDLVEVKGIDLKLDEPMIYKVGTPKLKEEMTNLDWMK